MHQNLLLVYFALISAVSGSTENCGVLNKDDTMPWEVQIFTKINGEFVRRGVGALLTNQHVLLLASTVSKANAVKTILPVNVNEVRLVLGKNRNETVSLGSSTVNGVAKIVVHDKANLTFDTPSEFDIAVIHLKNSLKLSEEISPVCLRASLNGTTNVFSMTEPLNTLKIDDDKCNLQELKFNSNIKNDFFCANSSTSLDDVFYGKDGVNGRYYVAGILNSAVKFSNETFDPTLPLVYERIEKYFDWISNQIKVDESKATSNPPNSSSVNSLNELSILIVVLAVFIK
jgi:hypothetical protein